jgi:heptosyltransferase-3
MTGIVLARYVDCLFREHRKAQKPICAVILLGRMGDIVACSPVAKELRRRYPMASIIWFCHPDFCDLVAAIPSVTQAVAVSHLEDIQRIQPLLLRNCRVCLNLTLPGTPMSTCGQVWDLNTLDAEVNTDNYYYYGPLLRAFTRNHAFDVTDEFPQLDIPYKTIEAAQRMELPEKYIVIHADSAESARNWSQCGWNLLQKECLASLPVVLVGKSQCTITNSERVIDFRDKLSIFELAEVIRLSALFVGIDSGPAHIANAVRARSFIILGRYRVFNRYCPYTGFFIEEKGATILQFPKECIFADPEVVLSYLRPLLKNTLEDNLHYSGEVVAIDSATPQYESPLIGSIINSYRKVDCAIDSVRFNELNNSLHIMGWAFDAQEDSTPDFILITILSADGNFVLDKIIPYTRLERSDVAAHLVRPAALFSGWSLTVSCGNLHAIHVFFNSSGQTKLLLSADAIEEQKMKSRLLCSQERLNICIFLKRLVCGFNKIINKIIKPHR